MTDPAGQQVVELESLRPTQMTVGRALVKLKRAHLRSLVGRPQELVDFIRANPIRVVLGPKGRSYVIDHHHFGLALIRENYKSAPMLVVAHLNKLAAAAFWKEMTARSFVRPVDARGREHPVSDLPKDLEDLADDPYRSLAGLVREQGGYSKTDKPYMEFQWADYFRPLIAAKSIARQPEKAVKKALTLAHAPEASKLPGFVGK